MQKNHTKSSYLTLGKLSHKQMDGWTEGETDGWEEEQTERHEFIGPGVQ